MTIPSCNSNIYSVTADSAGTPSVIVGTVCYCNCSDNYYSSSAEYLFISDLWGHIIRYLYSHQGCGSSLRLGYNFSFSSGSVSVWLYNSNLNEFTVHKVPDVSSEVCLSQWTESCNEH